MRSERYALAVALVALLCHALTASAAEPLRVGVTDDYRPFSFLGAEGGRSGIDITLARSLAAHLGRDVRFVATSWPSLLSDLQAGRFDLAMSGISRNAERARYGLLSRTYFVTGKTALARCDLLQPIRSLADVDRSSTRVIVNPGGTNERYARTHLQHAVLTVHSDNLSVFDVLAGGGADVMITDMVEARLVASEDDRLCVPVAATFNKVEKIVLLQRDPALLRRVDEWLDDAAASGYLGEVVSSYLSPPALPGPTAMPATSD